MRLVKVTEVRGFQLGEGWVQGWGELPGNDKWQAPSFQAGARPSCSNEHAQPSLVGTNLSALDKELTTHCANMNKKK